MRIEELIGANLREARETKGMTQQELGEALRPYLGRAWSRQAVSQAEKGQRDFVASELVALALVLERPVALFLLPHRMEETFELPGGKSLSAAEALDLFRLGGGPAVDLSEAAGSFTDLQAIFANIGQTVDTAAKSLELAKNFSEIGAHLATSAQTIATLQADVALEDEKGSP